MHTKTISEYKMTRDEIVRVQDCITEYMKMYFGAGVIVVGAIWFLARNYNVSTAPPQELLPAWAGGYVFAALLYIILSFATIIFHKFNTHNRYAGYARMLQNEELLDLSIVAVRRHSEIYLWEAVLGFVYNETTSTIPPEAIAPYITKIADLNEIDKTYKALYAHPLKSMAHISIGFWMMFRATIVKRPTRSWTYPYQIAFGLAITTALILFIWARFTLPTFYTTDPAHVIPRLDFVIQCGMFFHLLISWFGLSHRLYRLCGKNGDRTIEAYSLKFMVARYAILKNMSINVRYL